MKKTKINHHNIPSAFIKLPLIEVEPHIFSVSQRSDENVKKEQLIAKRESQNRSTIQEMMLIAILNIHGYDIYLSKPYKKSMNTMQYLHIDTIMKNKTTLWNSSSVNLAGKDSKQKKIVYDATITNFMIELLPTENISYKERITRKGLKDGFVQMKKLEYIEINKEILYLNTCNTFGSQMYQLLQKRMQTESIILSSNDKEITEMFGSSFASIFQVESPRESYTTSLFINDQVIPSSANTSPTNSTVSDHIECIEQIPMEMC